jgi:E3 ubiquitin-protein ligase NEDD4
MNIIICITGSCGAEEGIGSPGIGVIDGCKPPCSCWELNLGPMKEQTVFLTPAPKKII